MAKIDYPRLQRTAARLIGNASQGEVIYFQPGVDTGPEWAPVPGEPIPHKLAATKASQGETKRYRDASLIQEKDLLILSSVFAVDPQLGAQVQAYGQLMQVIMVDPATLDPDTPIRWFIGLRA